MPLLSADIPSADRWNNIGGRMIARGQRATAGTGSTGSEVPYMRVDGVSLRAGKIYRIFTGPIFLDASVANDVGRVLLRANNAGIATTASPIIGVAQAVVPNITFPEYVEIDSSYVPAGDETLSLLLTIIRQTGTGTIIVSTAATNPVELFVVVHGDDPGDTGVDL